jgi:hypothetical protein
MGYELARAITVDSKNLIQVNKATFLDYQHSEKGRK